MTKEKCLITTRTGEPYQPIRLYFKVLKPKTVVRSFEKLRCMKYSPELKCWRWLYENEAKKLRFENSYNKIDKQFRPLVLGDFYFRDQDELILDVRSFDRMLKAIYFFSPHLNRYAVAMTKLRLVNKFFDVNDNYKDEYLNPPFDIFFDHGEVNIPNLEEINEELNQLLEGQEDQEEKVEILMEYLENNAKKPLPEIEEIPLIPVLDTLEKLPATLAIKHSIAMQHWHGNTAYTEYDFFTAMMENLDELAEEE